MQISMEMVLTGIGAMIFVGFAWASTGDVVKENLKRQNDLDEAAAILAERLSASDFEKIPASSIRWPASKVLEDRTVYAVDPIAMTGGAKRDAFGRTKSYRLFIACAIDMKSMATPYYLQIGMDGEDRIHHLTKESEGRLGMKALCREVIGSA